MKRLFTLLFATITALSVMAQGLPEGFAPCAVSNLTYEWINTDGNNAIKLTFTTPTQMTKWDNDLFTYVKEDIPVQITRVDIMRSTYDQYTYRTISTITSPEKGTEYSYTDTGLEYGKYDYRIVVYVGSAKNNEWDWDAMITGVAGQIPSAITDDGLTYNISGRSMTIEVVAPATDEDGNEFRMPVNLVLFEQKYVSEMAPPTQTTLQTIDDVVPGNTYTFNVENIADGNHTYGVTAATEAGQAYAYFINFLIGSDIPGEPRNITASVTDEGNLITWEAPLRGQNGGDMGALNLLRYNVYRKESVYDIGTKIASNIRTTSYVDNYETEGQTTLIYEVSAVNSKGEGYSRNSNVIVVGPAFTLPFTETIETADNYGSLGFDNPAWTKTYSGNYCTWYETSGTMYVNDYSTKPHGGNGMAYAMYSSYFSMNQWDAITTGIIDFSASQYPAITMWYYDIPNGGSDITLSILTANGENSELTPEYTIALGNVENEGWQQLSIALPSLKGVARGQVSIRTEARGRNIYPVLIDDITIDDNESLYDPTTGIHGIAANTTGSEMYNLNGQRINSVKSGEIFIMNGKKHIAK